MARTGADVLQPSVQSSLQATSQLVTQPSSQVPATSGHVSQLSSQLTSSQLPVHTLKTHTLSHLRALLSLSQPDLQQLSLLVFSQLVCNCRRKRHRSCPRNPTPAVACRLPPPRPAV